jgi:wyosine [tRNA(Phe)-imidazoG37] synthetase (radical SAM superfamily)
MRLSAAHMPPHERVRAFAEQVARHAGYRVRDENAASRVVVLEMDR